MDSRLVVLVVLHIHVFAYCREMMVTQDLMVVLEDLQAKEKLVMLETKDPRDLLDHL